MTRDLKLHLTETLQKVGQALANKREEAYENPCLELGDLFSGLLGDEADDLLDLALAQLWVKNPKHWKLAAYSLSEMDAAQELSPEPLASILEGFDEQSAEHWKNVRKHGGYDYPGSGIGRDSKSKRVPS